MGIPDGTLVKDDLHHEKRGRDDEAKRRKLDASLEEGLEETFPLPTP